MRSVRYVLGIETSCDETAAAVVDGMGRVLSSVVSSQVEVHGAYGGVVPEIAARRHLEAIDPVVTEACSRAKVALPDIGGIAVTRGPGLIGCLLVGTSTARALALAMDIPVVGVNHLEGHAVSGWIERPDLPYPALALVVSGGHTALWRIPAPGVYVQHARTRDDAAGEAFDKTAKMLGLPYPGGPALDELAERGNPQAFSFGEVRIKGEPAFSFSGYKTAVRALMHEHGIDPLPDPAAAPGPAMADLAASLRHAIVRELMRRTREAIGAERPRSLVVAGGVAANRLLRREATALADECGLALSIPSLAYCGDNAAMIALAGLPRLARGIDERESIDAEAALVLGGPEAERRSRRHL